MELSGKPGLRRPIWDLKAEGGPMLLDLWAVSASEAKARDPERYAWELPPGMEPGSQHQAALAREAAEKAAAEKAKAADPHFGKPDAAKDAEIAELKRKLAAAEKPPEPPPEPPAPVPPPPEPPPSAVVVPIKKKARPRGRPFKRKTPPAQPGATT